MRNQFPKIISVVPVTGLQLAIVFDDGTIVMANLSRAARRGGAFDRLNDPAYFKRFKIIDDGRALAWPGHLDFCADALYGPRRKSRTPRVTDFGVQILPTVEAR